MIKDHLNPQIFKNVQKWTCESLSFSSQIQGPNQAIHSNYPSLIMLCNLLIWVLCCGIVRYPPYCVELYMHNEWHSYIWGVEHNFARLYLKCIKAQTKAHTQYLKRNVFSRAALGNRNQIGHGRIGQVLVAMLPAHSIKTRFLLFFEKRKCRFLAFRGLCKTFRTVFAN